MNRLILSFAVIVLGILVGQVIKYINTTSLINNKEAFGKSVDRVRKVAFFIFNPIILINSYWIVDFSNIHIFVLPFMCVFILVISGSIGLLFSKLFKHNNQQRASMFACSTFSNLGTIGGLIAFSFLGESGFAIAAMFIVLESFYNYLVGYPVVKILGEGTSKFKGNFKSFFQDPSIVIYLSAVVIGILLNLSPLKRPLFMLKYNEFMIPITSFLLIFPIAFKMNISKTHACLKEALVVTCIKFIIAPVLAISVAYLFGLNTVENGLVIKALIVMNLVPCGFNSILVPTIYKADRDVANSIWIFTMVVLIIIVPIEYMFLVGF